MSSVQIIMMFKHGLQARMRPPWRTTQGQRLLLNWEEKGWDAEWFPFSHACIRNAKRDPFPIYTLANIHEEIKL